MSNMLTNKKIELLKRYEKGCEIIEEDRDVVYKFASIGLISLGAKRQEGKDKETAKITSIAKGMLDRERNKSGNKLKDFLYSLLFI